ncbi:MAG: protein kinase [Labilithrix sp.]|nr:protein kinase [Labilithrix sp.]
MPLIDGRYQVIQTLGAGSMGVVYLAEDVFLARRVAIKLIDPAHGHDLVTAERFKKEAQALAQIRHHNVVQVYAFGPHEGSFYFAMEYVAGQSLDAAIESGAREVAPNLEILRAVASGLDAVHARKLVHRDVKPSNIVIENETSRPVLIDFGLARRRSASNPKMSITAGTPSYMAPEQATDPDGTKVTYRADIYALACSAWELLTGLPVFEGSTIYDVLSSHLKTTAPPLSSRRPDLAAADEAFARALSKDPLARHETASAFVVDVEQSLLRGERTSRDTIEPPVSSTRRAPTGPRERVLLLATDEALARRISRIASRVIAGGGRTPVIESIATSAGFLDALAEGVPSTIILDEEGTDVPVAEVVRAIRGLPGGRNACILVLTRALERARATLMPLGIRDILPKPLMPQMLVQAFERIVARRSVAGAEG